MWYLGAVFLLVTLLTSCATPRPAKPTRVDAGGLEPTRPEDLTPLAAAALDPSLPADARARALRSFGEKAGISAASVATVCLAAEAVELRQAAAEALGAIGGKDARAALIARLEVEPDPQVREALERAVAESEP